MNWKLTVGPRPKVAVYNLSKVQSLVMPPLVIGGQAVIEGVMMKTPQGISIAIRRPSGKIIIKSNLISPLTTRYPFLGWPIIRGPVILIESIIQGIQALNFSAQQILEENEKTLNTWSLLLTIMPALVGGLIIFVGIPHIMSLWIVDYLKSIDIINIETFWSSIIDGFLRIIFFIGYLYIISLMNDIKRIFAYHGAEHKSIHCFEAERELTITNAQTFSCLHPRCGTTFMLIMLLISIFVFSLVFFLLPRLTNIDWLNYIYQISLKIFLMLPIAGISYEFIRITNKKNSQSIWKKSILWAGLQIQRLTTREPNDDQVEIALEALKAVIQIVKV